jgi:hypothetical protein
MCSACLPPYEASESRSQTPSSVAPRRLSGRATADLKFTYVTSRAAWLRVLSPGQSVTRERCPPVRADIALSSSDGALAAKQGLDLLGAGDKCRRLDLRNGLTGLRNQLVGKRG